jgi:hypothetical protein
VREIIVAGQDNNAVQPASQKHGISRNTGASARRDT